MIGNVNFQNFDFGPLVPLVCSETEESGTLKSGDYRYNVQMGHTRFLVIISRRKQIQERFLVSTDGKCILFERWESKGMKITNFSNIGLETLNIANCVCIVSKSEFDLGNSDLSATVYGIGHSNPAMPIFLDQMKDFPGSKSFLIFAREFSYYYNAILSKGEKVHDIKDLQRALKKNEESFEKEKREVKEFDDLLKEGIEPGSRKFRDYTRRKKNREMKIAVLQKDREKCVEEIESEKEFVKNTETFLNTHRFEKIENEDWNRQLVDLEKFQIHAYLETHRRIEREFWRYFHTIVLPSPTSLPPFPPCPPKMGLLFVQGKDEEAIPEFNRREKITANILEKYECFDGIQFRSGGKEFGGDGKIAFNIIIRPDRKSEPGSEKPYDVEICVLEEWEMEDVMKKLAAEQTGVEEKGNYLEKAMFALRKELKRGQEELKEEINGIKDDILEMKDEMKSRWDIISMYLKENGSAEVKEKINELDQKEKKKKKKKMKKEEEEEELDDNDKLDEDKK